MSRFPFQLGSVPLCNDALLRPVLFSDNLSHRWADRLTQRGPRPFQSVAAPRPSPSNLLPTWVCLLILTVTLSQCLEPCKESGRLREHHCQHFCEVRRRRGSATGPPHTASPRQRPAGSLQRSTRPLCSPGASVYLGTCVYVCVHVCVEKFLSLMRK